MVLVGHSTGAPARRSTAQQCRPLPYLGEKLASSSWALLLLRQTLHSTKAPLSLLLYPYVRVRQCLRLGADAGRSRQSAVPCVADCPDARGGTWPARGLAKTLRCASRPLWYE